MIKLAALGVTTILIPSIALADFCLPPVPPPPTRAADAAEYREEFKAEFEAYFSEVTAYVSCLDSERERVLLEARQTTQRYDRFLSDAQNWND